VVYNPASPYAREMAKWEMGYSPYGPPGRPREQVGFQEYPAAFYKMRRSTENGSFIVEHMQEAADENEALNLMSRGYVQGRAAAEADVIAQEDKLAQAEAELEYHKRHMSPKAQAEAQAFQESTSAHVGEVPETPIRRRQTKE